MIATGVLTGVALASILVRLPMVVSVIAAVFFFLSLLEFFRYRRLKYSSTMLGVLSPLVPALGHGTLLALMLSFLLVLFLTKQPPSMRWAWPLVTVIFAWSLAEIVVDFDWVAWRYIYEGLDGPGEAGFMNLAQWLRVSPPHYMLSMQEASRYLAIVCLISHFSGNSGSRVAAMRGILAGLPLAAGIAVAQAAGIFPLALPNQSSYWTMQQRFTGSFTDPNAFGIFCVLCVPLIVEVMQRNREWLWPLLLFASVFSGILSGSRSFLVGAFLFLFLAVSRGEKKRVLYLLGIVFGVLLVWNIVIFARGDLLDSAVSGLSVGFARSLKTVSWSTLNDALFSRSVFFKAATRMWLDFPVTGAGFANFSSYVPFYLKITGAEVGTWVDNANNWYLQILAETGLLGAGAFLLSAFNLAWKTDSRLWKHALIVLAVLLVIGPHIQFDEVAFLVAVLFSMSFSICVRREGSGKRGHVLLPVLAAGSVLLIFSQVKLSDRGFYGLERDGEGFFRWTGRAAGGLVRCDRAQRGGLLDVAPIVPEGMPEGISLNISADGISVGAKTYRKSARDRILLPCSPQRSMVNYRIEVDRAWTPRKFGLGNDSRLLGVRLFSLPVSLDNPELLPREMQGR